MLGFVAEIAAGRVGQPEARRRSEGLLRSADRNIARLGTEADRRQASCALGLLVDELVAQPTGGRRRWTSPQDRPAGDPVPPLQAGFAAEAIRAGDAQADPGVLALWRACLTLSPSERADAARFPVPVFAPDLVRTVWSGEVESRDRLVLVGPSGGGKTCLIEQSGVGFRPAGRTRREGHRLWRASAAEAIEVAGPAVGFSPEEIVVAVLPADCLPDSVLASALDSYLILTGVDRFPGFDAIFADLAGSERHGACGVRVAPGESAASAFAAALGERLLRRLVDESDRGRRSDLLAFAARLAEACEQIAHIETRASHPPRLRGLFVTACPAAGEADGTGRSWFVRGLFEDVLLPGASAAAARRRHLRPGAGPTLLLALLLAGLLAALWLWSFWKSDRPTPGPAERSPGAWVLPGRPSGVEQQPAAQAAPAQAEWLAPGPFSYQGAPAAAYERVVQPACQAATQDRYPFFGSSAEDASAAEMRRVFGSGGLLPSFLEAKVRPLITTDGPVWRWRRGVGTDGFDPVTPELFAKLPALGALIGQGLEIGIEAVAFGGGVTGARLELLGAAYDFDRLGRARSVHWRLREQPADASLALLKGGRQARRYQEGGVWSLFRLIGKGDSAPEADGSTLLTFSDGEHVARFRLRVAGGARPFERGGMWSFRCPSKL
ncbi:MAG TPA: type VI secretion protein IcmF/TssM N-terminal domain-containing protein [Allosphingosinicella sp.]|jgi:hypothetical protein